MSIRTIVEVNHDYINRLMKAGHISKDLYEAILLYWDEDDFGNISTDLQGIRRLASRHHSDKITLRVV
jgi:hypothetical protein